MADGLDPAEVSKLNTQLVGMVKSLGEISESMKTFNEDMRESVKSGKEMDRSMVNIERSMKKVRTEGEEKLSVERAIRKELLDSLKVRGRILDEEGKEIQAESKKYQIMMASRKEMLRHLGVMDKRREAFEKENALIQESRKLMKEGPAAAIGKMAGAIGIPGVGKIGETVGKFKEAKKTGTAMAEAGGAMGGMGGGMMKLVGKAGPYGMIIAAVIQGLKSLFDIFDQANKKMVLMRNTIYTDVGAFDTLSYSVGDTDISMRTVKKQFDSYTDAMIHTKVALSEMMTIEERLGTMKGFKQAGTKITEVISEISGLHQKMLKGGAKAWKEMAEKDPTLIVRRRSLALGKTTEEMAKDFADWSYNTGISLLRVNKLFDQVTKYAIRSGLATNQFLAEIQAVAANMDTFTLQIIGAAEELDKLSKIKILTPKEAKEGALAMGDLFKAMGDTAAPIFSKAIEDPMVQAALKMREDAAKRLYTEAAARAEDIKAKEGETSENYRKAEAEAAKSKREWSKLSVVSGTAGRDILTQLSYLSSMGASMTELVQITALSNMGIDIFNKGQEIGWDLLSGEQIRMLEALKLNEAGLMVLAGIGSENANLAEYQAKVLGEQKQAITGLGDTQSAAFSESMDTLAKELQPQVESASKMLQIVTEAGLAKIYSVLDQIFQSFLRFSTKVLKKFGLDYMKPFTDAQTKASNEQAARIGEVIDTRLKELEPLVGQGADVRKAYEQAAVQIQQAEEAGRLNAEQAQEATKELQKRFGGIEKTIEAYNLAKGARETWKTKIAPNMGKLEPAKQRELLGGYQQVMEGLQSETPSSGQVVNITNSFKADAKNLTALVEEIIKRSMTEAKQETRTQAKTGGG